LTFLSGPAFQQFTELFDQGFAWKFLSLQ